MPNSLIYIYLAWNYFEFSFVDSHIVCENDSVICFFLVILSFLFFSSLHMMSVISEKNKNGHFFSFQSQ